MFFGRQKGAIVLPLFQLQYFQALANGGNLTRAAGRLRIIPSNFTLSGQTRSYTVLQDRKCRVYRKGNCCYKDAEICHT